MRMCVPTSSSSTRLVSFPVPDAHALPFHRSKSIVESSLTEAIQTSSLNRFFISLSPLGDRRVRDIHRMTTPANVAFDAAVFTTELGKVVDNFQKLVKSTSPAHPGALQDVYVDKMLVSVKAVLEASRALQCRAGISDVEKR